jgi:hypothetical protein
MRCYFIKNAHIVGVEDLSGSTDKEAIEKAHALFADRADNPDGFEVWELSRIVWQQPKPETPSAPEEYSS